MSMEEASDQVRQRRANLDELRTLGVEAARIDLDPERAQLVEIRPPLADLV